MKSTILILGGLGFIGQNIIEELQGEYNLIIFDHSKAPINLSHAYIQGDFTKKDDVEAIFKNHKVDIVLHAISTTIPASNNTVLDIDSNLTGTINLLEFMRKYSVPKIVFLSSGGTVYGLVDDQNSADEDHPTYPISSHGIIKLAIEKYVYLYHHLHHINYLILRLSNPFGEKHSSDKHGLINIMLKKIINKEKITIWGDGKIIRDYIYVKDCVKMIHTLINKNITDQIINIGSGQGHSINDILLIIRKQVGDFEIEYEDARRFDVPKIILSTHKLQTILNIQLTPIEEGISKTYAWLKSNRK